MINAPTLPPRFAFLWITLTATLIAFAAAFAALAINTLDASGEADAQTASAAGAHPHAFGGLAGHEADEGLILASQGNVESVQPAVPCAADDAVRAYDITALNVEITLNRYLDYDPEGRMYALTDEVERVRAEEAQNAAARAATSDKMYGKMSDVTSDETEPAVSNGLQGDAIQPLILRVNQGECLRVTLRNELTNDEPASFHLHGSGLYVVDEAGEMLGAAAIAANPAAMARPGETVVYEWRVAEDEPEGTHYFHSHGSDREQTNHGLFGALIVEPRGATYFDPRSGEPLRSGWDAIIRDAEGSDFREFVMLYHEIGTEKFRHLTRDDKPVTLSDPLTGSYKPGGRALNYRSEPFMNRLALQYETMGRYDSSLSYNSYAFGDPATPMLRAYLGDPTKQRVVHAGSEVFHVHHVHGGAIRWRRQPDTESTAFDTGLDKQPTLLPQASERLDSQGVGPSESYDIENECGAGGCQQGAGDFLYHCHVGHHYLSGMWGLWRVYNTLQDGTASQDELPPLVELPDRGGNVEPAVTSAELVDTNVAWPDKSFAITDENLSEWVEQQLPPPGTPKGYDASVLDWRKEGDLYLNEAETTQVWPGYRAETPGERPPIRFDPVTGKLAYPFLRPHFGQRPPFAPGHGPAPFLDMLSNGNDPPAPGENGEWSLCPAGTKPQEFTIHAINLPITLNARAKIVDPVGQLFVLKEEEEAVRADNGRKTPLAIRANAGEECIDIVFKSELKDSSENRLFSKASLHIHFVQFDVQASDGVSAGFNYEQTVRPFTIEGETILAAVPAGAERVQVSSAERFQPGILVGVGMDEEETFEIARIAAIDGDVISFDAPLRYAHAADEIVSTEFLRHRWYPDVQFGTAYFHDHVSALTSWRHGLFGALIAEPPGSTYHDPATGAPVRSGTLVDVRTDAQVSADVEGSFREMVLFVQDDNRLTKIGDSSGSAINMRVEPLSKRQGVEGAGPDRIFSSAAHGDPETPILRAYLGDPIVIRGLVPATSDVHTLHIDGHWFRLEPFSPSSPPINTVHLGISERTDLMIRAAGGPQRMPGDYLYQNGRDFKLREGSWGLIRVLDGTEAFTEAAAISGTVAMTNRAAPLQKLPGRKETPAATTAICPDDAPRRAYAVSAIETPLPMLDGEMGRIFVTEEEKAAVLSGAQEAEPLVLHVSVGDCIEIALTNELGDGPVSFYAGMLATDPRTSLGIEAGYNPAQVTQPGATRLYIYYAHPEVGETVALVRDGGDLLRNPALGLYGAIIVGPPGATYTDPVTGADLTGADGAGKSAWRVDVHPPGAPSYRDFTLLIQDEDPLIGTAVMPYTEDVRGVVGLNYRKESLLERLDRKTDRSDVFRASAYGDPATPLLEAYAGDPVRIHVLVPYSEQAHVFTVEGHQWPLEPQRAGSDLLNAMQVGALEAITLVPVHGAGGDAALPGDYLYGDHREPYRDAGLWGLFRVYAPGESAAIRPLPTGP